MLFCRKQFLAAATAVALSGCGGGGGERVASTPPPVITPSPTPTPTPTPAAAAIEILAAPATQEFAALSSIGSSSNLRIRFDAATSTYEVLADGISWQGLRPSSTYHSTPERYFSFGSQGNDQSFFQVTSTAKDPAPGNYQYSSLAVWGKGVGAYWDDQNFTAFGVPTSASSMPVTGSASYQGIIRGNTDVIEQDNLIGDEIAATIHGSVTLNFDFGAGTLAGSIQPILSTFNGDMDLGSLSFVNTVYSSGSTAFSGTFNTQLAGPNSFNGQFTGPAAQELIGRWAFPFVYSGDGATHSASGAWIAKR